MTGHCLKNITPDGITGMIFAMEGIKNTIVLLNGPMGCKFYHSTTSQHLAVRPPLYLPSSAGGEKVPVGYHFLNNWFFRQSRVPCTYLDGHDYVYGTMEKVKEALDYIQEHIDFELFVIVNSPGASLIGDHLKDLAAEMLPDHPRIMLESPGYSTGFCAGYEMAFLECIRQAGRHLWQAGKQLKQSAECMDAPEQKKERGERKRVNLLGLSVWHRYWDGDLKELKRLFELCRIEVNCVPFADTSMEELQRLDEADLNVVLYPEMALAPAKLLEETIGMPYYVCSALPVGFSATEKMFADICELLGTDVSPLMQESEKTRAAAWFSIDGIHQMCGLPNGALYAVEGTISQVVSFGRFFSEYLGMIPDCLAVTDGANDQLQKELEAIREQYQKQGNGVDDMLDTRAELVFAEANTIAALKTRDIPFCGIEISRPEMGYVDLILKTQMGLQGSLFLIEQVLNGLMSWGV